ncbi:MAG: 30S ribosomal protein S17e [Candidatus Pacearchaeota archaeon]
MGKIKSKLIRKAGANLVKRGVPFIDDFGHNKKILGNTMPSKKIRNRMAGFLVRLKKQEKAKQMEFEALIAKGR